jgi:hypothetical protein
MCKRPPTNLENIMTKTEMQKALKELEDSRQEALKQLADWARSPERHAGVPLMIVTNYIDFANAEIKNLVAKIARLEG